VRFSYLGGGGLSSTRLPGLSVQSVPHAPARRHPAGARVRTLFVRFAAPLPAGFWCWEDGGSGQACSTFRPIIQPARLPHPRGCCAYWDAQPSTLSLPAMPFCEQPPVQPLIHATPRGRALLGADSACRDIFALPFITFLPHTQHAAWDFCIFCTTSAYKAHALRRNNCCGPCRSFAASAA